MFALPDNSQKDRRRLASRRSAWMGLGLAALLGFAAPPARAQSPVIQFSTNQYSVLETDGFATITATLRGGDGSTYTVDYATRNGTATNGLDYLEKVGTLVFSGGQTSRTFTVLILDNSIINPAKTVLIRLSDPSGGATLGIADSILTIEDNDITSDTIEFQQAEYTVLENSGLAVITVIRSGNKTASVTVNYATSPGGTATAGQDYLDTSGQLFFGPGQAVATFVVTIQDDLVYGEGTETVNLVLTDANPPSAVQLGRDTATLKIEENDFLASTFLFLAAGFTANEGDGFATITVTRAGSTLGLATVDFFTADGTATAGLDYGATNGTLTFTNGQLFARFQVPLMDDDVLDLSETVQLFLTNATAGATISQTSATLTLLDNDSAFQFSTDRYVTNENGLFALVTVIRQGGISGEASVELYTADSSVTNAALSGFDYTGLNTNLVFATGQTFTNVAIPLFDDFLVEQDEPFIVYLSNAVSAVLGPFNQVEVVILDNDTDAGTFEFVTNVVVSTPEFARTITVTVARRGGNSGAVTVDVGTFFSGFDFCPGGTNASQFFDIDYTLSTNTLAWADGEGGTKSLTLQIEEDDYVELDENIVLDLFNATGGASISANDSTLVASILFDDPPPGAADRFYNMESWLNPTPGANNLVYATAVYTNGLHTGKSIVAGDFTSFNATVRSRIARVYFDGTLDLAFDPGLGADGAINAVGLLADGRVVIGGAFTSFDNVSRNGVARLNEDGTLDPTFNPGAGVDGMVLTVLVQSDDKVVIGGFFESVNGVARRNLARLNADGSLDETFDPGTGPDGAVWSLSANAETILTSVDAANSGSGPAEFRTNITVDVSSGVLLVGYNFLSVPDTLRVYSGTNLLYDTGVTNGFDILLIPFGPGTGPGATLTLVINEGSGALGTVWSFYAAVITASAENPLLVGGDFTSINGVPRARIARLNPDGSVDTTFDPGVGADSTVYAVLNQPDGRILVGGAFSSFNGQPWQGLARLTPGGAPDRVLFNPGIGFDGSVYALALQNDGKIVAGGDFVAYNQVSRPHVARLYPDGTLDTGFMDTYYNVLAGPDQFVASVAIYPFAETNVIIGTNIASRVVAGNSVFIGGAFTRAGGGLTISETLQQGRFTRLVGGDSQPFFNLPGNVEFASSSFSVDEHGALVAITVRRVNGILGNLHIQYVTVDGSAVAGVDYEETSGELFWDSCDAEEKTFLVPILDDAIIEGNKTFQIVLRQPVSTGVHSRGLPALGFQDTCSVLIIDNDFAHGLVGFPAASLYVSETAGNAVVTVTRTGGSNSAVSVRYATSNGTALAPADYTPVSGTLLFAAGETVKTFTIPVRDDTAKEFEESFFVRLFNATGGAQLSPGATNLAVIVTDNDNGSGSLSFQTNDFRLGEAGGAASVTVRRTSGTAGPASVDYLTVLVASNGWAYPGVDYQAVSGTLAFAAGELARTFEVPILDDLLVEGDETILLLLTNVQGAGLGYQSNAWITIVDDDSYGRLGFAAANFFVNETAPEITITVARLNGSSEEVAVDFATLAETAVDGEDFTATNGTLVFLPGETNKSFTVSILDDAELEAYETVTLVLSNFSKASPGRYTRATLAIIDDESLSVPAGTPNAGFTAALNGFVQAVAVQEDARLFVGGAFTAANGIPRNRLARLHPNGALDLTFDPGAGLDGTVLGLALQGDGKVIAVGDFSYHHGVERFNPDGTRDSAFNPGIGADNPVHAVAVDPEEGSIALGGAFATFGGISRPYVALLRPDGKVDAGFMPAGGPNAGVYALAFQPDGKLLIAGAFTAVNGAARGRVARLNRDGSLDASFLGADLGANGTIYALALQPDGRILVGGSFDSVNGSGRQGLARLNPDGSLDTAFLNGLAGANGTVFALSLEPNGALLVGGDFTAFNGLYRHRLTRLHPDGSTDATINFGIGANSYVAAIALQADNQIVVGGGFTTFDGLPREYVARLVGGATTGPGLVQFARDAYEADESALNASITLRRVHGTTGELSVEVLTRPGTALPGEDYVEVARTIRFADGEGFRLVNVPLIDDTLLEMAETLEVFLNNPSLPDTLGEPATATLTITSDDALVGFTLDGFTVNENVVGGSATIQVERTYGTNASVTVDYAALGAGSAATNIDFIAVSGTLTFAPGERLKFFTVPILNDSLLEGPEFVWLLLHNPSGPALLGRAGATLTIIDDDAGPGLIEFASAAYLVSEAAPEAHLTVTRTNGSSGVVTVRYAAVGGTATPNADYGAPNGYLTFNDGETVKTLVIPILPDDVWEGYETVVFQLSQPTGGALLGTLTNTTLTLQDDDAFTPGVFRFSTNQYWYGESAGTAPITVERTLGTTGNVRVDVLVREGSAIAGRDMVATNLTLEFAEGEFIRTIFVPILGNTLPNETRRFDVLLANPAGGALVGEPALAAVFLEDDDLFPGAVDLGFDAGSGANGPVYALSLTPDFQLLAGGGFTTINGVGVNRLAEITTNAIIDLLSFNPGLGAGDDVLALAYGPADEVYVAGRFLTFNGQARARVARLLPNGVLDPAFNPGIGPNGAVHAAAIASLPVYTTSASSAGGSVDNTNTFDIQATTASLSVSFTGATNETNTLLIYAIVGTNNVTVANQTFTGVSGTFSTLLAPAPSSQLVLVVNAGATTTNTWSYTATAQVGLPNEHQVVIGGDFTAVGATNRNYLARLNWDGSLDLGFTPAGTGLSGPVYALTTLANGQIVAAGNFTNVGSVARGRVARFNRDGSLDPFFNPGAGADAAVLALAVQADGRILIAGAFTNVAGAPRPGIARLLPGGQLDISFDPGFGANGIVHDLHVQADGTILVVGAFTEFNAEPFARIVRLNPDGSLDRTFDPGSGANDTIYTVMARDIARTFAVPARFEFGGLEDRYDLETGTSVGVLDLDYSFFGSNSTLRVYHDNALLFDTGPTNGTGSIQVPFGPGLSTVLTIVVNEGGASLNSYWFYSGQITSGSDWTTWIGIGGNFTAFDGVPRSRIAILTGGGRPEPAFDPGAALNTVVYALALHDAAVPAISGRVLVGGDFGALAGVRANRIGRLLTNGVFDPTFNVGAGVNGAVRALALQTNGQVLAGGLFTAINNTSRSFLARLNPDGSLDPFYNTGTGLNNAVYAIALQPDGRALVGGLFNQVGSLSRNFLARMTTNGSPDLSFNPGLGANGPVRAIAVQPDQRILVGGDFTEFNGLPRTRLARLHPDGSLDLDFAPDLNGSVHALALAGNQILVGGAFTAIDGIPCGRLARLHADGTVDTGFNQGAGANDYVSSLLVQPDGRILVGGGFTTFHGLGRNRLARLNPEGGIDPTINFGTGADNFVTAIVLQPEEQLITIGGGFGSFNGLPRIAIARLLGGEMFGIGNFQFTIAEFRVPEDHRTAHVTVVRQGGLAGTSTVQFTTADETGLAGRDYQTVSSNLVFAPGEIFKTIPVPLIDDSIVNGDRTVLLVLSAGDPGTLGSPNPARLTVLDNESLLGFSAPTFLVNEASLSARITVSRTGGSLSRVTAQYASSPGTALPNFDYTDVLGTVVFDPGVTAQSFNVPVFDDFAFEGDETVLLHLYAPTGPVTLDRTNATLLIVDDDISPGVITFSTNLFTVFENQGAVAISVNRIGGRSGTVSARYQTSDGSARVNEDYLAADGVVVFGEGETNKTFFVPILDDLHARVPEGPETIRLTLSNPNGGAAIGLASALVTIYDDDGPGTLVFTNAIYQVTEGVSNAVIEVQRLGGSMGEIQVSYIVGGGTATPGLRYQTVSNRLSFASGQTVAWFAVPLNNTVEVEGVQTINLLLADPTAGVAIGTPTATLELYDDDVSFSLSAASYSVAERSSQAIIGVIRHGHTNLAVSVRFETTDVSASAGASAFDGDYRPVSGVLTFDPGVTNREFIIEIRDDSLPEIDEVLNVTLSNPVNLDTNAAAGSLVLGPQITAPVTILDDDVEFNFTRAVYRVLESGTNFFFSYADIAVTRRGGTNLPAAVSYQTSDGSGLAGFNYGSASGILDFVPGQVSNGFQVVIYDDTQVTGDWTVNLSLFNPTNGVIGSQAGAVLVVQDDERSLSFASTNFMVSEKGTNAVITVQRLGLPDGVVAVTYYSLNDTALAPQDYLAVSNRLVWEDQEIADKTFTVPVFTNAIIEGTKTVRLFLTNPTLGAQVGPIAAATLQIIDNAGSIAFTSADYRVVEGSEAVFPLVRTGGTNGEVSVRYTAFSGSATAGVDFTNVTGVVAFGQGEATKNIRIPIEDDTEFEGLETFTLALSQPTGAVLIGQPATATVSIADNDTGRIALVGAALEFESLQPPNNFIESNETVTVQFAFRNIGSVNTTNLTATLLATNGIVLAGNAPALTVGYGVLVAGGSAVSRPFSFRATGAAGSTATALFRLHDGPTLVDVASLSFPLGVVANTFANNNAITINDNAPATPYPAPITVSGVAGLVNHLTVTINNLRHNWPGDIDMVLVGPNGAKVMLMSDCGDGASVINTTLTFDDAAPYLPYSGSITNGRYRPSNYDALLDYFPNGPGEPFDAHLSVFNGINPNGAWRLYVVDDGVRDDGLIAGGWAININSDGTFAPTADVSLAANAQPGPVLLGGLFTHTLTVANHGPAVAEDVVLTYALPAGATLVSSNSSQGTVTGASQQIVARFGSLGRDANASLTVELRAPNSVGLLSADASVQSRSDSNSGNDTVSLKTDVVAALGFDVNGATLDITWPDSGATMVLESATRIGPGALWTPVSSPRILVNGTNIVNIPVGTSGSRFYRLRVLP